MNDTDSRPPRSLVVVLLDGVLRLVAAVHSGATPTPKVREAGERRGVGRYLLVAGVVAALAGTALLVVMLVRAPDGGTPPPDRAAALPGLASRTAQPSVDVTTTPEALGTTATPSDARSGPTTATTRPAPSVSAKVPITENAPVPLTASYRTSSVTAGLLGYRMAVTVANPGTSAKDGWTVTVTLPRSTLRVTGVSGATAAQDGSVWTFTPDAVTSRVPAGGSVELAFEVRGATLIDATPQDCRIDGNRCGD
jgi:hypothetical protein